MKTKILKGSIVVFVLLLLFVSVASISAESNDTSVLSLSKSGITINYPSNWGYSQAISPYSIMAISKADDVDSFGVGQVNINIEKKPIEGDFAIFILQRKMVLQRNTKLFGLKKVDKLTCCFIVRQWINLSLICMFLIISCQIFKLHNFFFLRCLNDYIVCYR